GMHASYDEHKKIDMRRIEPLVSFARLAANGDKLFFVTHSEIPTLAYVSTNETASALLDLLGVERKAGGDTPSMPHLPALGGPRAEKDPPALEPRPQAERGGLSVRGYAGARAETPLPPLHQMATTAPPPLAAR